MLRRLLLVLLLISTTAWAQHPEDVFVGQKAPEFSLRTEDGDREYRLSQYRGRKPVVLIFGTFT